MAQRDSSRRRFVHTALGGVSALWIGAPWEEVAAALAQTRAPAARLQVLSEPDAADVEAVAAQIIPSDGTPGAREARVIHFIDYALSTFASDQRKLFTEGIGGLKSEAAKRRRGRGATSFATLPDRDQRAILEALERAKSPFFEAVRTATIMGMFADPRYGGNAGKAGWRLLGFDDRFSWAAPFGDYDRPAERRR